MTLSDLWPRFQGHDIFDIECLRNDTRQSHSYHRTSIGRSMRSIKWWRLQWPSRTPNPFFKVTAFWSRISQKTVRFWGQSCYRTL